MTVAASILSATGVTVGATGLVTASVTPTPDALQLLFITLSRESTNQTAPSSVVGNGLTWTLVLSSVWDVASTGRRGTFVYRAMATSPTAGTTTITRADAPGVNGRDAHMWIELTGAKVGSNGANALIQAVAGTVGVASDTPTVTLAAFGSVNNATLGHASWELAGTATAGTGFTKLGQSTNIGGTGQICLGMTQFRPDNDTSVDCSLTAGTGANGSIMLGFEIAPAPLTSLAASVDLDLAVTTNAGGITAGVPLAATIAPAVTVSTTMRSIRPRPRSRRSVLVYVADLNGDTIGAIG